MNVADEVRDVEMVQLFTKATPKARWWAPHEDITAYELAIALSVILQGCAEEQFERLPESVKRHFGQAT